MKNNIILLFTCIIFGFYHAQIDNRTITKQSIEKKLASAKNTSLDPKKRIQLYLQIFKDAKDIGDKKSILTSGKNLMILYYNIGENEKSIEYSYELEKAAKEADDNESIAMAYIERGTALSALGLFDENYKELRKAEYFVNKLTDENKKHFNRAHIYQGLTSGYYIPKKAHQDTILLYFKKSLQEAEKIKDVENTRQTDEKYDMISYLYMNIGMYYAMISNPKRMDIAEEYLQKSLNILNQRKFTQMKVDKIPILNYLGHFYSEQGKNTEAIEYAQEVLQLEKRTHSPASRVAAYATLTNSFESLKNKDSTIKYMALYSNLSDSLAHSNKMSADKTIKKISQQKDKTYQNNILQFTVVVFIIALVLVAGGWWYWKRNQNKLHQRYETIIEKLKKEAQTPEIPENQTPEIKSENNLIISEETTTLLLNKLSKFEKSEKFLKKDLTLTSLSNSLATNPRYLSEIIKQYKNKSFNNYINGLRIQFITNKLYDTPIFREYKISYLAEACGFSSREVFAVIFKKETGVSPSYFINQLKKEKTEE
ncbi:YesN/AraC family two-component response regulator [Chryseobacterium sediminis]|uniref:YesN/AraC family two-component response regulator n=1 Tax=Chryseobacterium sediminis TaxID=1679494 RepID=A0ABR6PWK6_9FLAO|nr:AraC family transcriptional regulator [Chryseobacterium sediminis]MBB6330095.1 YesN/AraC family two-component response regulator [Chryseobacterium sediminis]